MTRFATAAALAAAVLLSAARAQTGQPPVTPNPGDVVARFDLVGVTAGGSATLTGFFTYDFTLHGWVTVEIHFPSGIGYGNVFSDPVHISTTSISGSHNSQTISYDFDLPFAHALTPSGGSPIALDPPGTSTSNLNAWLSIDNGQTASILRILGGVVQPVTAMASVIGTGCTGGATYPHLTSSAPTLGSTVMLHIATGSANAAGVVYFSFGLPVPVALGSGCTAWVDLATFAPLANLTTDASGTGLALVGVPSSPALAGLQLTLQGLFVGTPSPLGYDLTNGLGVIVGY